MPLEVDDEPGSWGRLSEGWPDLRLKNKEEHDEVWRYIVKDDAVPYGSYVDMSKYRQGEAVAPFIIRFETTALKMKVHTHMQTWKRAKGLIKGPKAGSKGNQGRFLMRGPSTRKG